MIARIFVIHIILTTLLVMYLWLVSGTFKFSGELCDLKMNAFSTISKN